MILFRFVWFRLFRWVWHGLVWYRVPGTGRVTVKVAARACPSCMSILQVSVINLQRSVCPSCKLALSIGSDGRDDTVTSMCPNGRVQLWRLLSASPAQTLGGRLWHSLTRRPSPSARALPASSFPQLPCLLRRWPTDRSCGCSRGQRCSGCAVGLLRFSLRRHGASPLGRRRGETAAAATACADRQGGEVRRVLRLYQPLQRHHLQVCADKQ